MQKAIWEGQILYAYEVAEDFSFETLIRKASSNKKLRCTDPDCDEPIVRYCNGGEKEPYFAHLVSCDCDYCKYEKKNASTVELMKKVAKILKDKGYNVDVEKKLFPGHISQITAEVDLNNQIAVDFISRQKGVYEIEEIAHQYESRNINYTFVVADDNLTLQAETRAFFAKRYALNKHNLLMINWQGDRVKQIALDLNKYGMYKNKWCIFPDEFNTDLFVVDKESDCLVFEHNHLSTPHFEGLFNKWLKEKREFYDNWKLKIDKAEEEAVKAEAERFERIKRANEARRKEEEKREAERRKEEEKREAERQKAEAEELIKQAAAKEERIRKSRELLENEHPKLLKVLEIIKNSSHLSGRFQFKGSKGFEYRRRDSDIKEVKIYKNYGISAGIDDFTSVYIFIQENNEEPRKDNSGAYFINIDLRNVNDDDIYEELSKHINLS